jgi:hypothetical protein|tara:strand:+ start:615 stop:734 length:120 start_codon:yes stop_codon:yes gene_type:complete
MSVKNVTISKLKANKKLAHKFKILKMKTFRQKIKRELNG